MGFLVRDDDPEETAFACLASGRALPTDWRGMIVLRPAQRKLANALARILPGNEVLRIVRCTDLVPDIALELVADHYGHKINGHATGPTLTDIATDCIAALVITHRVQEFLRRAQEPEPVRAPLRRVLAIRRAVL